MATRTDFASARYESVYPAMRGLGAAVRNSGLNGWNRFAIAFGAVPGSYRRGEHSQPQRAGAAA